MDKNESSTNDKYLYVIPLDDETLKELYKNSGNQIIDRNKKDNFIQKYWRPSMAVLYLLLCSLDYGIRPVANQYYAKQFDLATTVQEIKDLEPATQIRALEIASRNEIWPPILNEFVHLAFGAILTGAAVTRGLEKVNREKNT